MLGNHAAPPKDFHTSRTTSFYTSMETIAELIAHPEQLNKDTLYALRELVAKYPYYQAARLLFLKNLFLLHDPQFGEELRRAALYLPDRRVLFKMIEGGNYEIQPTPLHKDEEGQAQQGDRTASLIDNFLRTASATSDDKPTGAPHHQPTEPLFRSDKILLPMPRATMRPFCFSSTMPCLMQLTKANRPTAAPNSLTTLLTKSPNAYNCKTSLNTHPSKLPTRTTLTMRQKTVI